MRLFASSLRLATLAFVAAIALLYAGEKNPQQGLIRFEAPRPLSFQELVTAATVDPPPPDVQQKLDKLLSEPFISNEATLRGAKPKKPAAGRIGPLLRIAEWNINRGENQQEVALALSNAVKFEAAARANGKHGRKTLRKIHDQLQTLQKADIVVLDEVDDGVKRTDYRNVARDLAQVLDMNYAYGVEFIELNGIYIGAEKMDTVDLRRERQNSETFEVNPQRYLGLEGSAILSRYPIRSARIVHLPQAYDWYHGEIKAISDLERARRWSAETLFQERIRRQVRRGGRMALAVDLEIPESPTGILTIICPHLEDYSPSSGRRKQMDALLEGIRANANPVVVAGDFNTTGHDGTPVTIKRALLSYLLDYRFWARQIFYFSVPAPGLGYILAAANYFKNFHDPTAFDIPIFAANREKQLFEDTRTFRFNDGSFFSFDTSPRRSFHHKGRTLAASNQRAWKGFATTFSFARTYHGLVGKYKIDWFFVKPPRADRQSVFAPFSGRTLGNLNTALGKRISDHSPITVDLPLSGTGVAR